MSQWITDRRPRLEDSVDGFVLGWHDGKTKIVPWNFADYSDLPWMPIGRPEPYVEPKRYTVLTNEYVGKWLVWHHLRNHSVAEHIPTREAAERIAAIYNEVLS